MKLYQLLLLYGVPHEKYQNYFLILSFDKKSCLCPIIKRKKAPQIANELLKTPLFLK